VNTNGEQCQCLFLQLAPAEMRIWMCMYTVICMRAESIITLAANAQRQL